MELHLTLTRNLMSPYETRLGLRIGTWVLRVFLQGLGQRFR
jgi:hypothetical protein